MGRWKNNEVFRKQARAAGYRSRAAFKLLEIEQRFKILQKAKRIVDLCCAPGSWLQVVKERIESSDTIIVGIDIEYLKPISGVRIIRSSIDATDIVPQILEQLIKPAQVILSDCAPKLTGNKALDRQRQLWLAQLSLELALQLLDKNGHFVTKVFQSAEFQKFITQVKQHFKSVKTFKPKSSFKRSPEMYLIAKRFRGSFNPISPNVP